VAAVRASGASEHARFVAVSTGEPSKDALESSVAAGARLAEAVVMEGNKTIEVVIDLNRDEVVSSKELTGVQPPMTVEEFLAVQEAVREHPLFVEALRRRGIDDMSLVDIDPISAGYHGLEYEDGDRRLARILAFVRPSPGGNAYSGPVEGVFGALDVATREFVHFEDRGVVPLPPDEGEFRASHLGPPRDDLRPIEITQPEGASFSVHGYEVRWQRWRLRLGYTQREGLVLHEIGYEDSGRVRPILHRASYAEMVVPYADPDRSYQAPLDIGEFNIGTMSNSLKLGCDCLGLIHYFDVAYAAPDGTPVDIQNAICMHEEDVGILWKHTDFRTGHMEVRRARRLVISTIATVGNYDYGFFWYLYQDGTIEGEVKATGIVATKAVPEGVEPEYGRLVAPQLSATNHQHIFCARLDFDIDGTSNTVCEIDSTPVAMGSDNPHGNAWKTVERPLKSEAVAKRDIDIGRARTWLVTNPSRRNSVGRPVAYRLVSGDNTVALSAPDSYQRKRASFIDHHLWVTPYSPTERYPAGDYPYQHKGGAGLAEWTAQDRAIEDTDLVVWYTMVHHHVPRPEDWPVMPVVRIGFQLRPVGFFDRNPALDVPAPPPTCH
jgi:primary-amine oxidase